MIISVLIIAVFAVAAGILLFSTPGDAGPTPSPTETTGIGGPDDGTNSLPGLEPPPPPSPTAEPSPVIELPITSITVFFGGNVWNRDSFSLNSTDMKTASFQFTIEPPGFSRGEDFNIQFISNDENFATVEPVTIGQEGRYGFIVTRVAQGNTRIRIVITNNGEDIEVWSRPVHVQR
jgi:hypothetical protein